MTVARVVIGAAGVAFGLFGVYRLLTQIGAPQLASLAVWIVGAVVLHDAVLSPIVVGIGVLVSRLPSRARRYVQGALIAGGLITSLGIVFVVYADTHLFESKIAGSGSAPRPSAATREAKSLLTGHYGAHLLFLLVVVAGAALLLYLRRLLLDARSSAERR